MSSKLLYAIIAAIVAAFTAVFVLEGGASVFYFLGLLFLDALKTLIVPLIMLSVMSGITKLGDVRKLGGLGLGTVAFYLSTMLIAASIGLGVVNLLEPGVGVDLSGVTAASAREAKNVGLIDLLSNLVGPNIFQSMAEMDLLPIIIFSLVFGAVTTTLGDKGKVLVDVIEAGNAAMMKLVGWVMWLAPIGIFGLVAGRFGQAMAEGGQDGLMQQIGAVGSYVVAVLVGLGIHFFIVLPAILLVLARRSPLRFLRGMGSALLTAFATASSSATLPVTLDDVTRNNEVDERAARFVIPLGSTVNMDGSALYEAMAAMFVAQSAGIALGFGDQALVVLTSALAAMGAAGVPEAGLVTLLIVLRAVDLPLEGLELLLPVDWFLDRFRTATNVWGDAVGACVLERATTGAPLPDLHEPA